MINSAQSLRGIRRIAIAAILVALPLVVHASQAGASTLPGRNGKVAAISYTPKATIGLVTQRKTLRSAYSSSLSELVFADLSFSPSGQRILFVDSAGSTRRSLTILNLKRDKLEAVGTKGLNVSWPSFLANGHVVFSGKNHSGKYAGTFEIRSNGAHLHRLFERRQIAASPNGQRFVATGDGDSYHTLFLLNRRGEVIRRLTRDPDYRYIRATFSPDGRWIAYEREIERSGQPHRSDIFVVRRDGTHRRRLTHGGNSSDPAFSPDGRWIAFAEFNGGSGGNLSALVFRHPRKRKTLTRVAGADFRGVAWGRR